MQQHHHLRKEEKGSSSSSSNTRALKAEDIVKGKIPLENLPEPYLFVHSGVGIYNGELAKALNILAIKKRE
jgi:hypothetical protein